MVLLFDAVDNFELERRRSNYNVFSLKGDSVLINSRYFIWIKLSGNRDNLISFFILTFPELLFFTKLSLTIINFYSMSARWI